MCVLSTQKLKASDQSSINCDPTRSTTGMLTYGCSSGTHALAVTNSSSTGLSSVQQEVLVKKSLVLKTQPSTQTDLEEAPKYILNYLSLHPQISSQSSLWSRTLFADTDHSEHHRCRAAESSTKSQNETPKVHECFGRGWGGKAVKPEAWGVCCDTVSWDYQTPQLSPQDDCLQ